VTSQTQIKVIVLCGFFLASAVSSEARSAGVASSRLFATVSRAGSVQLRDAQGRQVKVLHAGTYVLTARDRSRSQNFRLAGTDPAVKTRTGVKFVGSVTWKLSFPAGLYHYYSEKRPAGRRSFRVTS